MTAPDPIALRDLAVALAGEGAALAMRRRRNGVAVAATKSSAVDIVTAADREVEALIRTRLAEARPEDAFLGEESDAAAGSSGLTWVVDPIDGTVNYLYDRPAWAVSVAVVEGDDPGAWRALAGCVAIPATGETCSAALGHGATRNGAPIAATSARALGTALVATGFAYDARERVAQAETAARVIGSVRDLRRAGSAAIDLCDVAAGRLDGYWERGLQPWDFAAGALVAEEAGAVVRRDDVRDGRRLVVAVAPGIADELRALLAAAGA
ncbi:MAG: inositol monophosphatase [Micrococcales bacterium 73-13]|nr:MAG: inositol monophosphatase [Micrococcales bacterium 73-13]